jgi:AcrR family transcriptional regulator
MSRHPRALRTDGEATRLRILEAAGALFALHGYAGTTGKAVAERAGVDLASINYHYGSRGGLYQAVLVEAHRRVITLLDVQQIAGSGLSAPDKLRRVIERLVEGTSDSRGWHTLVLAREMLAASPHLRALFTEEVQPKFRVVKGIIGEITGIAEDDPALLRCMLSVAAPCAMLLVIGPNMPSPFQEALKGSRPTLARDLHAFLLGGLQAFSRAREAPELSPPPASSPRPRRSAAGAAARRRGRRCRPRPPARRRPPCAP